MLFSEKLSVLRFQQREHSSCPLLEFLEDFSSFFFSLSMVRHSDGFFALDLPAASQKNPTYFHILPSNSERKVARAIKTKHPVVLTHSVAAMMIAVKEVSPLLQSLVICLSFSRLFLFSAEIIVGTQIKRQQDN